MQEINTRCMKDLKMIFHIFEALYIFDQIERDILFNISPQDRCFPMRLQGQDTTCYAISRRPEALHGGGDMPIALNLMIHFTNGPN